MSERKKIRVLFVCLGNICRSPMAEAVFRKLVEQAGLADRFEIASAATSPWEVGKRPHPGTQAVLRAHDVALDPLKRSHQLTAAEFKTYDAVIAMDRENLRDLARFGAARRLMEFAAEAGLPLDIPDPYYDGNFELVYQMVLAGCQGLLAAIRKEQGL